MKMLMVIAAVFAMSTTAFADVDKKHPRRGKKVAKVMVKGEKAQAIFEALDAEIETKDRKKFTVDVKKVATLKCAKLINKEDTSKVKFLCSMKGKKNGQRMGRGHHRRGQHRGPGPRRGRGHRGGRHLELAAEELMETL